METKRGEKAGCESQFGAKEGISGTKLGKEKSTRGGRQQWCDSGGEESRRKEEG